MAILAVRLCSQFEAWCGRQGPGFFLPRKTVIAVFHQEVNIISLDLKAKNGRVVVIIRKCEMR